MNDIIQMMEKSAKRLYGWSSLVFLIIGMGIYLFFRGLNVLLFEWIPKPDVLGMFHIRLPVTFFTSIVKFNMPDMVWFLSGICFLRFIWFNNNKWQNIYIGCFYGIAVIFETTQLSKNIPGTFDPMDLLFMGIGAFVEGLLYKNFVKRRIL